MSNINGDYILKCMVCNVTPIGTGLSYVKNWRCEGCQSKFDLEVRKDQLSNTVNITMEFKVIEVDVPNCSRCNDDHKGLKFKKFIFSPVGTMTHWSICPNVEEPILMKLEDPKKPVDVDEMRNILCEYVSEEDLSFGLNIMGMGVDVKSQNPISKNDSDYRKNEPGGIV